MKKRTILFILALVFLLLPQASNAQALKKVNCEGGAILVEFNTSNIIYEQDADKRWQPASITKMMTAIIALEKGNLSDDVRFSKKATSQEGSKLGLKEGLSVGLSTLIEAMMVKSGNDAAVAIAEHIAGSEAEFVKLMNAKALELDMTNTHFMNASGLPNDSQYSTARDISKLAVYAMGREEFRKIVSNREIQFINPDNTSDITIYTTNRLMGYHPLVDGIKTGFTQKSKFCLAASAAFRDYRLISVVLGADRTGVWDESARLLDYGFAKHDPLYPLYREFEIRIPVDESRISEEGASD